jgi:hypothetical protein
MKFVPILKSIRAHSQGNISVIVLLFGLTFTSLAGGLALFGGVEHNNAFRGIAREQALAIAEAGVNYYRWHLAHDPDDYQNGTGEEGPYVIEFNDPESGVTGTYELEIIPPEEGSEIVTIRSTGRSDLFPTISRTVTARFGPEPLTKYSFLHNSSVWFGQGLTVYGEVFSNGGIRFDGINESIVRSARETYTCGSETGCSPSQTRPGVWGSGGPNELWEYPVPVFDFDSVVTDFNLMRQAAQSNGIHLGPTSGYGYRISLNSNGTFTVYRVNYAYNRRGYSAENGCENLYQDISSQTQLGVYNVEDNKIVYAEDTVWVDGTLDGELTIVAARLPVSSYTTNMWINGNVEYASLDGSDNLGLIAQNNIYYAREIPDDFVIHAAMMAQEGRIMRHHYDVWWCGSSGWAERNSLTVFGSVISNQKSYWNWSSGSYLQSGFETREIDYNQSSAEIPPPYYPSTEKYRFLSWEEE